MLYVSNLAEHLPIECSLKILQLLFGNNDTQLASADMTLDGLFYLHSESWLHIHMGMDGALLGNLPSEP